MRRMIDAEKIIEKPQLYYEQELTNESSININLPKGVYMIELHQTQTSNMAFIKVGEDPASVSTVTMFNAGGVGAALGYYYYDIMGQLLEIYDGQENNITANGHIDIYKF